MTDYRRIVVRTPNWVGDAVMALPFLASLRLNAPDSEICVLTRPILQDFFSQVRECDGVLSLNESHGRHGLAAVWRNARSLRRQKFDLGFCLPPSFGAALMMRLAGVRRRVGHAVDARGWLLTDSLPHLPNGKRPHRADGYLSLLGAVWRNPKTDKALRYEPGNTAREGARALCEQHGIPDTAMILAVAPGAAQLNKLWPAERFAEVCRRWLDHENAVITIVGGAGDRDTCGAVAEGIRGRRAYNLCGAGSLPLTAAIIRRADLFVGNDSGLSHLAAAVGVPVVVISGPGDPSEVAPYVEGAITVKRPLFCSPCYRNTCYRKDHPLECQHLVTADDVWDAVHSLPPQADGGGKGR